MLTATFYGRGAGARGQLEARAAQSELQKASDSLQRLLSHEGQYSKETVALIDEATKRLQRLRSRVEKHAELVNKAREGEEKMAEERDRAKNMLDEVEKDIARYNLERVSILTERDEIRRDILLAKRTLEVRALRSSNQRESCWGFCPNELFLLCPLRPEPQGEARNRRHVRKRGLRDRVGAHRDAVQGNWDVTGSRGRRGGC